MNTLFSSPSSRQNAIAYGESRFGLQPCVAQLPTPLGVVGRPDVRVATGVALLLSCSLALLLSCSLIVMVGCQFPYFKCRKKKFRYGEFLYWGQTQNIITQTSLNGHLF